MFATVCASRSFPWVAVVTALFASECTPSPRFALRPPVLQDNDTRPFAPRPSVRSDSGLAVAIDQFVLRPVAHALAFEHIGEAHNVNALDEVPDSTWFTNRTVTPEEAAHGPCPDSPPQPPFIIERAKTTGWTPGLVVRDALGRRYAVKIDQHPDRQPEINTAAEAIVSRIYWAIGYNTPCYTVEHLSVSSLRLAPDAHYLDGLGRRQVLRIEHVRAILALGVRRSDGTTRVAFSLFVPGEPLGPWPTEGVRPDDPNDTIPHEHRRELRGEHFLAAWVNHWDAREPNALDTFVHVSESDGYVRHWQIDFGDCLGAHPLERPRAVARIFGSLPWLDTRQDTTTAMARVRQSERDRVQQRTPFDVEHFDPMAWEPWVPMPRFRYARLQDLAWMARRIAAIGPDHIRAIVATGKFSDPATERHIVDVLIGRRAKILRWSFARTSPLAHLALRGPYRLCASDLAVATGMADPQRTHYTASLHDGVEVRTPGRPLAVTPGTRPEERCLALPPLAVPPTTPETAPERYAVVDLVRIENGTRTLLRAHFYDLGPPRGFVLVGIER